MIILYTKSGCPWCDEVRDFLSEEKINFYEREVLSNKEYFDELVSKSKQTLTPTLDIDGEIFPDLGREETEEIFKSKNII